MKEWIKWVKHRNWS